MLHQRLSADEDGDFDASQLYHLSGGVVSRWLFERNKGMELGIL